MKSRTGSVVAFCALVFLGVLALLFVYLKGILKDYGKENLNLNECRERLLNIGCQGRSSGVHWIDIPTIDSFPAVCDGETSNGGWIVIQRRFNGSENFNRSWSDFRNGFGQLKGEFFIGLESLHRITNSQRYELYIELRHFKESLKFASYDNFRIANEDKNYELESLGAFNGTAEENLSNKILNRPFSTYDNDNDQNKVHNCALKISGGWWYNRCAGPNLNRRYYSEENQNFNCMSWDDLGLRCLKSVRLLIRPKCDFD